MLITRNNYETFFLLYADNELRANERLAVEDFILENEDLRRELNMTLAAVLTADDFSFTQKAALYKNSFVDGSLQEKLLLKIDNELFIEELDELNKNILVNVAAIKEEQLLSATKLDATETIICPQKELLYKKEKDTVVAFRIIRWAAAAILIGFVLFFGFSIFNNKNSIEETVAVKEDTKPSNFIHINPRIKEEQNVAVVNANKKENNNKIQPVLAAIKPASIKKDYLPKMAAEKILVVKQKELASSKEVEKIISPSTNTGLKNVSQTAIASITKPEEILATALTNDNIVPLETTYAQTVSLSDLEKSNNKILYMDEEDLKHSKVGGIFKKFKRMIERTAKIKTGNPIRIAGFQIGTN